MQYFYPRPPRGGRRRPPDVTQSHLSISIHALREEGDADVLHCANKAIKFLSTPSARRATRLFHIGTTPILIFLSTPSARRATTLLRSAHKSGHYFYPRPPRGGRLWNAGSATSTPYFYPRPPRGGRPFRVSLHRPIAEFLSTPSARRATAKTERKPSAFVSLYTSLHKLQRGACKTNRKITPLLAQTAGIPVRSVWENHVRCLFALAGHQKISTLSCANSGCSPTCSTLVW